MHARAHRRTRKRNIRTHALHTRTKHAGAHANNYIFSATVKLMHDLPLETFALKLKHLPSFFQ